MIVFFSGNEMQKIYYKAVKMKSDGKFLNVKQCDTLDLSRILYNTVNLCVSLPTIQKFSISN